MAENTMNGIESASAPSTVLFPNDKTLKKLIVQPNYLKSYVPSGEVKSELHKISGRLRDCLYYEFSRGIPTPKSNVEIDQELALLIAAEEKIKLSRKNFRRMTRLITPSCGPTQEEKHELRTLNRNSVRGIYELEDFIQDFDEKPFVATRQIDISLKKIANSIKSRQIVLLSLRKAIYEASVSGYHVETMLFKKIPSRSQTQASKEIRRTTEKDSVLEISKRQSETALEDSKTRQEKSMRASKDHSKSDSDDISSSKELEVYQTENSRLEKNLEMFGARLHEFANSRQNVRGVATETQNVEAASREVRTTRPRTVGPEPKKTKPKFIMVETDKPLERMVRNDRHNKNRRPAVHQESDATDVSQDHLEVNDPPSVKTKRQIAKTPKEEAQTSSDHRGLERTDKGEPTGKKETNGDVSTKSETRRQRNDTEAKKKLLVMQPSSDEDSDDDDDIPRKLTVKPVNQDGSDVIKQVPKSVRGVAREQQNVEAASREVRTTRPRTVGAEPKKTKPKFIMVETDKPLERMVRNDRHNKNGRPAVPQESDATDVSHDHFEDSDHPSVKTKRQIAKTPKEEAQTSSDHGRLERTDKRERMGNKETNGNVSTKFEIRRPRNDTEAKKKLLVMQPSSDEDEDSDDDDVPRNLPVQPVNQVRRDVVKQVPKENKEPNRIVSTKSELGQRRNDTEAKPKLIVIQPLNDKDEDDDVPEELPVQPVRQVGSDVAVTKRRVILPLPTLDPMPVYTDNFQASCVLTHLFSSRDEFDEDFEPDYVIPSYKSEQIVYTGKQCKVYSRSSKHTSGHRQGRC